MGVKGNSDNVTEYDVFFFLMASLSLIVSAIFCKNAFFFPIFEQNIRPCSYSLGDAHSPAARVKARHDAAGSVVTLHHSLRTWFNILLK